MIDDRFPEKGSVQICAATEIDACGIAEIYKPYVENTTLTSEYIAPSAEEICNRINKYINRTPWLVLKLNEKIIGYAYAARFRSRAGYDWIVESSVYVHENYQRMSVAKVLYNALFKILTLQGFHSAIAGLSMPNDSSIALHLSQGFEMLALYEKVNFKMGNWHDVQWMRKILIPHEDVPTDIIRFSKFCETHEAEYHKILLDAEQEFVQINHKAWKK